MNHQEKALEYFGNNFNCSQAVFTAFAPELGFDEETALRLAAGFGGGARKGELCGAVAGALMVLGMKYGHCHLGDAAEKNESNRIAADFMNRFLAANESVVCRELLKRKPTKPVDPALIKDRPVSHAVCPELVRCAAEIVDEMIKELDSKEQA